jgi:hypothetical protein
VRNNDVVLRRYEGYRKQHDADRSQERFHRLYLVNPIDALFR